jgi:hypothetical protein
MTESSKQLQALIKQVKYKRYAKGDPKRALLELMDEVEQKVHHFRKECWNITIELLADHLGLLENPWKYSLPKVKWTGPVSKPSYHGLKDLKGKIPVDLIDAYIAAAKAKPWDHLGMIFEEEQLAGRANRLAQILTPRQIVDFMVKCVMDEKAERKPYSYAKPDLATLVWQTAEALAFNDALPINLLAERARRHTVQNLTPLLIKYEPQPITDLDPCTGTGRFLLGATLMYPKLPLLLYGIEIDVSLYRACLVNMAMFSNHPYSIICADTLMIDQRYCDVGSKIWDLGNRWEPADISPFYWKPPKPFKFSLAEMVKTRTKQPPQVEVVIPLEASPPTFSLREYVAAKKKQT